MASNRHFDGSCLNVGLGVAKRSHKSSTSLKSAFQPDAWMKFESLMEAASSKKHPSYADTAPEQRKGLRSAPLARKTPLQRTALKRKSSLVPTIAGGGVVIQGLDDHPGSDADCRRRAGAREPSSKAITLALSPSSGPRRPFTKSTSNRVSRIYDSGY